MTAPRAIAVVGASLAGVRAVEALRRKGFEGSITLIGAEPHLPYDRPPLSKQILMGTWDVDSLSLRRKDYAELELDLRLGRRATGLDLGARQVELDDGSRVDYDGLIIATGASPRELPGTVDLEGIHLLRTLDDALAIRAELASSPRVAVVGAGFIGSEVAASCRARGLDVTLIEALEVPLMRGLGREMGQVCAEMHRDEGVSVRCGVGVAGFGGERRVECVRLGDGSEVAADLVVIGVGVAPETKWLESSGLLLDDGVVCDATCATRAPGVVAAGDVARWYNPVFGEAMRVEHWTNAVEQGVAAAGRLLAGADAAEPFASVPFVWSDQYAVKIQAAGHIRADDQVEVISGSVADRKFTALYGREDRLTGVLGFSRPRDVIAYQRMIGEGISWADALQRAAES
jgi:NADPH-dependent 2,4-dienoyl-CoA reductase/sulfur reductase-like enzyme